MAQPDFYHPKRRAAVAAQLSSFRGSPEQGPALLAVAPEASGLAESFQVWTVSLQDFHSSGAQRATWRNVWHHQLRPGGAPAVSFVRTLDQQGSAPEIRAVYSSPLAGEIDLAIDSIDQQPQLKTADSLVRVLEIPELRLPLFWIRTGPVDQYIPLGSRFASRGDRRFEPIFEQDLIKMLPTEPTSGLSVGGS